MLEIKENFTLKKYNTLGIDVKTRYFAEYSSVIELIDFLNIHPKQDLPLIILGGGSNVLFTKDFQGYILRPNIRGIEIILVACPLKSLHYEYIFLNYFGKKYAFLYVEIYI